MKSYTQCQIGYSFRKQAKMKKKGIIILGGIVTIFILAFIKYSFNNKVHKVDNTFPSEYDFAVIDTTGQVNKSFIYYYDNSGKLIYEKYIDMGYMGDTFSFPQVYENKVYVTPWGIDLERELSDVLEIDIENENYRTFDTSLHSINSLAITDQYFFVVNTINAVTKIARTDRETSDTVIKEWPDYLIGKMAAYNNVLYAFGSSLTDMKSELIEIDIETLDVIRIHDIGEFGESPADSVLFDEGNLYFTLPYKNNSANNSLTALDTKTKEIREIKLPELSPSQLLKYQDYIIISHVDNVMDEGNSISILNTNTGELVHHELHNKPRQIYIKDNYLYSLDITDRNICRYELKSNKINLLDQFFIEPRKDKEFYFLSGFFCK